MLRNRAPRVQEEVKGELPSPDAPAVGTAAGSDVVGQLFMKHGPMVYRRAARILGRHEDAEEALHEVFIRVLRCHDRFDGRSEITTWLYQITTNYCLNQLRDQRRRRQLLDENLGHEEEVARAAEPEDLLLLRRLLRDADAQQGQAVVYVFLDGMSQEEAARVMGVSQRTVSNLVERFMRWAEARANAERDRRPGPAKGART